MNWEEYRKEALSTRKAQSEGIVYTGLALAGEAGEVANEVKKWLRDEGGHEGKNISPAKREKILLELGDVLWYLTSAADILGASLHDVAVMNIEKLRKRREAKVGGVS